jgi:hypothetical protein
MFLLNLKPFMKKILPFLFVAAIVTTQGCKKDDDNNNPSACNVVNVTESINTATTWTKGNVYVISDLDVAIDATLTIQAGVIIKFKQDATLRTSNGQIIANGTAADPVIFTAYTDDDYCGDTNGDGNATTPAKGFWGGLKLQDDAPSNLTYCKFLYAGADVSNGANLDQAIYISSYSDGSTIDHCTFAHTSGGNDPSNAAVNFGVDVFNVVFTNNVFYDNGAPVTFQTPASAGLVGTTNIFHNPDNASQKNVQQALIIKANQDFTTNTNLSVTELPYLFYYSSILFIDNDVQVVLANNVTLKFSAGQEVDMNSANNSGFINATGTGVVFTSALDDARGGDSNGDGNLTSPATADWDGIYDSNIPGVDKWAHWGNIYYQAH